MKLFSKKMATAKVRQLRQAPRQTPTLSCVIPKGRMISIGSRDISTADVLEVYDPKKQLWMRTNDLSINRRNYKVALIDNKLMLIGGTESPDSDLEPLNKVESIDLSNGVKTAVASLQDHRQYCGTVVVGEGKTSFLYVFGGWGIGKLLKTVERWDPISKIWTYVTPMTSERTGCSVAVLRDKIYVVGGRIGGAYRSIMEAYNIKFDAWEIKAPLKYTNAYFGMASHKNYLYVVAGNKAWQSLINTVERYDPNDDSWSTMANVSSMGIVAVTSYGNKLVCAGGRSSRLVEEYDEERNQWRTISTLNIAREGSTLVELPEYMNDYTFDWPSTINAKRKDKGKLLCIGSRSLNTAGVLELYDPILNTWTQLKSRNIKRINIRVALIDNKLLIMGGSTIPDKEEVPVNTVEYLDLSTGVLTIATPLQEHRRFFGVAVVGEGKTAFLFVFGGWGLDKLLKTVERWDPISRVWTYVTPMTEARTGCGVAVLDNKMYAVGGRIGNYYQKLVEAYDVKTDKWETKAPTKYTNAYFGISITAHKNYLYMVAGNKEWKSLISTVERYDPKENSWTSLANITSTGVVGVISYGNKLVCAGGRSSKIVEEYDEEKNEWVQLPSLNVERETVYLVELPESMNDYKFNWN